MKNIYRLLLSLFIFSLSPKLFAVDLMPEIEVVKRLFSDLNTTYPYLLRGDQQNIYSEVEKKLSQEITTQRMLLEIKSKIYGVLESNEEKYPDWHPIYHAVHINSVRSSKYARQRISKLLSELQSAAEVEVYDRLLVPASGKFYEFPDLLAQFNASLIVAEDVDDKAIEFTRGMFGDNPKLVLRHLDLSKRQSDKTYYDAVLFIHPHVTDYDELAISALYRAYDSEFHIPYMMVKNQNKQKFISKLWIKIILNSLARLKVGGYAFFIFYEHRELDIVLEWLNSFSKFKVVHSLCNDNMIDFAFSKDYLEAIGTEQENTAKYVVMGAYRAGLLVQKTK
ncbi:hypothetical protein [Endozoicomonas sp. 4G]|uniref:hypothetical protein n=1 Tax=Endozoicomonas sp. 4G TaxID=2872754 RepID=UPI0020787ACE|nr:hypothetical protein [Endozoicomonas sp. 4G]